MKKTTDINIAGQLFRIDEEAWEILKRYLDHVSARFTTEQGGDETVADIEARIAEIFGGGNEPPTLVSKQMVNDMINIMGAPEDYYDDNTVSADRRGLQPQIDVRSQQPFGACRQSAVGVFQGIRQGHVGNIQGDCNFSRIGLHHCGLHPALLLRAC
ncbi:MAG: hypothetical protein MZV63_67375 [Marinilabiliales bacterium]|nr:hypothetical protein [Marinilabiliales bacterium]